MKIGQRDFFERLLLETRFEQRGLFEVPQIQDAMAGAITKDMYLAYLAQAYHHVRHTVPLMELTQRQLPKHYAGLREALWDYIEEESGHDEWILEDLRACGGAPEEIRSSQPNIATEIMISYAYDFVSRINPLGFFGMIFVLESTSVALASKGAHAVAEALDLPQSCFRYLTSHGTLDQSHIVFFRKLISSISDEADQSAIVHMAKRMFVLYGGVFRSIPRRDVSSHGS